MKDVPTTAFFYAEERFKDWNPGDPLMIFMRGAEGAPWPIKVDLVPSQHLWKGKMAFSGALISPPKPHIVLCYGPLGSSQEYLHSRLVAQLEGESNATHPVWVTEEAKPQEVFWLRTTTHKSYIHPHAIRLNTKWVEKIKEVTDLSLPEHRAPSVFRFLDTDHYQWWIPLNPPDIRSLQRPGVDGNGQVVESS